MKWSTKDKLLFGLGLLRVIVPWLVVLAVGALVLIALNGARWFYTQAIAGLLVLAVVGAAIYKGSRSQRGTTK